MSIDRHLRHPTGRQQSYPIKPASRQRDTEQSARVRQAAAQQKREREQQEGDERE